MNSLITTRKYIVGKSLCEVKYSFFFKHITVVMQKYCSYVCRFSLYCINFDISTFVILYHIFRAGFPIIFLNIRIVGH